MKRKSLFLPREKKIVKEIKMCLAVPMRVKRIGESGTATVEFGGITKKVNIQLLKNVKHGEYLLIHAGVAIEKVDQKEAEKTLQLLGTLQR